MDMTQVYVEDEVSGATAEEIAEAKRLVRGELDALWAAVGDDWSWDDDEMLTVA